MSKKKLKLEKKAMTLVELLIYMAITMIVLVVVIDLVTRIAQIKKQGTGQEEISNNANFLIERLTYAIQSSSAVVGSYPDDNLILTTPGGAAAFRLDNGQINYALGAGAPLQLTTANVEILPPLGGNIFNQVSNGSASSIQIKFSVKFKQNNLSRDFQTSVLEKGK